MAVLDSKSEIAKIKQSSTAVLICFDDKFAPAAGVMLTSLFLNNRHIDFDLYAIVKCDISSNLDSIELLCESHRQAIKFIDIDKEQYSFFNLTGHFSHAAYFRIFAPGLIDTQRILYLDVDIIVQMDISPLLDLDIGNHIIAGALDNNPTKGFRERLGLSPKDPYINTGVLLINADLWRKENITATLIDYYTRHKDSLKWADQDLINVCLSGRIRILDQQWNFLYGDIINRKISLPHFDPALFQGIFHYNTSEKPWFGWAKQPFLSLYEGYAAKSPIRPQPPGTFDRFIKHGKRIAGKLLKFFII